MYRLFDDERRDGGVEDPGGSDPSNGYVENGPSYT